VTAPSWMTEGASDVRRHQVERDYAAMTRRGARLFDRAITQLEADHAAHKASIAATGDKLDDIAVRLRAINPKLFDAVRAGEV
jgi:hypothetical protein